LWSQAYQASTYHDFHHYVVACGPKPIVKGSIIISIIIFMPYLSKGSYQSFPSLVSGVWSQTYQAKKVQARAVGDIAKRRAIMRQDQDGSSGSNPSAQLTAGACGLPQASRD
jgi:hypothetical protein